MVKMLEVYIVESAYGLVTTLNTCRMVLLRPSTWAITCKSKQSFSYSAFSLKLNPNYTIHEPLHTQNDETSGNILQQCPIVAADALLQIGTNVISAVLSLDELLSLTNTFCVSRNVLPVRVLLS
jgi:hypothetical protein